VAVAEGDRASIEEKAADGTTHVYACSAAKAGCIETILRGRDTDVTFVYLKGTPELLQKKSGSRHERATSSIPNFAKASLIL